MAFKQGNSGNKLGRPRLNQREKDEREEIKRVLKANVLPVIDTLISIATSKNHPSCVKAAQIVLDRAYGNSIFLDTTDLEDQVINVIVSRAETKQGKNNNDDDDEAWLEEPDDKRTGLTDEEINELWESAD